MNAGRLASIDVFRALTMFLMIFVNDLWTLKNIPGWLEHAPAAADALGLADVVFPMFLFIVGLSIPLAVNQRMSKGDSKSTIARHTLLRSVALIVMGLFHVNLESYNDAAILPRPLWEILITICFFLIWLDYKNGSPQKKYMFQGLGVALLVAMAIIYRGENGGGMTIQWWGILGLIGWSYLIGSVIYLLFLQLGAIYLIMTIFFLLFSAAKNLHWLDALAFIRPYVWILSDGAFPALVMGGITTMCFYRVSKPRVFFIGVSLASVALIVFCFFATRPWWGIHKIAASPSWVSLCIGISALCFVALIWLVDVRRKESWFAILKPAGTSTLTVYLLPYFHYAILAWAGVALPLFLRTGAIGILKSLLYALILMVITGFLEKRKVRLKI
ncbi:MAG TPA: DUF5009 domain-containing protein [Cyclobacteriaceae bacterium]|jgi:predicted acyltransferase|nr:DUF5009 domain-containing protein [Cyclobacteriaceae bacterium]